MSRRFRGLNDLEAWQQTAANFLSDLLSEPSSSSSSGSSPLMVPPSLNLNDDDDDDEEENDDPSFGLDWADLVTRGEADDWDNDEDDERLVAEGLAPLFTGWRQYNGTSAATLLDDAVQRFHDGMRNLVRDSGRRSASPPPGQSQHRSHRQVSRTPADGDAQESSLLRRPWGLELFAGSNRRSSNPRPPSLLTEDRRIVSRVFSAALGQPVASADEHIDTVGGGAGPRGPFSHSLLDDPWLRVLEAETLRAREALDPEFRQSNASFSQRKARVTTGAPNTMAPRARYALRCGPVPPSSSLRFHKDLPQAPGIQLYPPHHSSPPPSADIPPRSGCGALLHPSVSDGPVLMTHRPATFQSSSSERSVPALVQRQFYLVDSPGDLVGLLSTPPPPSDSAHGSLQTCGCRLVEVACLNCGSAVGHTTPLPCRSHAPPPSSSPTAVHSTTSPSDLLDELLLLRHHPVSSPEDPDKPSSPIPPLPPPPLPASSSRLMETGYAYALPPLVPFGGSLPACPSQGSAAGRRPVWAFRTDKVHAQVLAVIPTYEDRGLSTRTSTKRGGAQVASVGDGRTDEDAAMARPGGDAQQTRWGTLVREGGWKKARMKGRWSDQEEDEEEGDGLTQTEGTRVVEASSRIVGR